MECYLNNIDKGGIIGAIFFDLRKAFDVVDHQLLIEKVNSYHFSNNSVNWKRSYLTDRQQRITEKQPDPLFKECKVVSHKAQFLVLFFFFYL